MALSQNPQDDPAGTKYSAPIPLDAPPAAATAPPQASPAPANAPSPSVNPPAGAMARVAQAANGGAAGFPQVASNYFVQDMGLTPEQAQGGVQALMGESRGDPTAYNGTGGGLGAYGIPQVRGPRQQKMIQLFGPAPTTQQQLEFINYEFHTTEKAAFEKIKAAKTPEEARKAWSEYYERSGGGSSAAADGVGSPESAAAAQRVQQDRYAEAADLRKQAQVAIDQIKSMGGDLSKSMERVRAAQDKAEQAQEATLAAIKKPPQLPVLDSIQKIGGLATVVGILGGLLTRSPMRASINGAAAAIEAYNSGDQRNYQQAYADWKTQLEGLTNVAKMQSENVRQILYAEDMGLNERKVMLDTTLRAMNLVELADRAITGGDKEIEDHFDKIDAALAKLTAHRTTVQDAHDFEIWKEDNKAKNAPGQIFQQPDGTFVRVTADGVKPIEGLQPGASKAGNTGGQWSKESMEVLVDRALATGDQSVLSQLPRTGAVRKQFEEALATKLASMPGGISGGVAFMVMNNMRMAEAKAAATRAGQITMNTQLYSAEAEGAAKLVVDASKKVPRTNLPAINRIEEAGLTHTGDPNVVQLGISINSLLNAYGKMSNPTGTGIHDADKQRLEGQLTMALSQGQIEAGVAQIVKEGVNLSQAAQTAQTEVLKTLLPEGAGGNPPTAPPAGGGSVPAGATAEGSFDSKEAVVSAYKAGTISRDEAKKILKDRGWTE